MRFKTVTLGCKVNQYETEWFRDALVANGWEDVDGDESADADYVVVNTCAVTQESGAKSRKTIAHFAKTQPDAKIVVIGCDAAVERDELARLSGVFAVEPDKRRLPELARKLGAVVLPTGVSGFHERRRAYVKVQDGCRVGCAYCIIPTTRPYLQSRPIDEILDEARTLARNGYREIVLTGIHLGHYGLDLSVPEGSVASNASLADYLAARESVPKESRVDLADLLDGLTSLNLPSMRYRLGSLEAVEVSDAMLRVFERRADVLCPHFHLSMQSGDDEVLAAMKRRWSSAPYIEKCREIVERVPNAALTTDVIVGFPGETDAQFERTCEVVRLLGFSRVHVFRFSARPGTVADGLPRQISPEVKKERAARLLQIAKEERERFAAQFVGATERVIVEEYVRREDGSIVARGTSDRYYDVEIPLNECKSSRTVEVGDALRVRLDSLKGDVFTGTVVGNW